MWYNQTLNHTNDIMQPSNHRNPNVTHSSNHNKGIETQVWLIWPLSHAKNFIWGAERGMCTKIEE